MYQVKRAKADEFEKIYPLLLEFNNPKLKKTDWRQIFVNHYGGAEDYCGFVIYDQDRAIGFQGLVFSERLIDGRIKKICNMAGWIVAKEYRGKEPGILLLREVVKLEDYTITNLSAAPRTEPIMKKFGYKKLESHYIMLFPLPRLNIFSGNECSIEMDHNIIKNCLNDKDKKIYNDHLKFNCDHFIIRSNDEYCYVIARKVRRKKLPFAYVHYISNLNFFLRCISRIRNIVCLPLKVFGLLIEERFLKGNKIDHSILMACPGKLYRSNTMDRKEIVDNLYTELFFLL
jgi:hypothetical protein